MNKIIINTNILKIKYFFKSINNQPFNPFNLFNQT